jgi:hypothetical protein
MGEPTRTLSAKKLDEVAALFDASEEALGDTGRALNLVQLTGKDCRRPV